MEEVEDYLSGERNYVNIHGGTGPLVYPAGFLYVYQLLRYLAGGDGSDVRRAQFVFAVLYVMNAAVVLTLYTLVLRLKRRSRSFGETKGEVEIAAAAAHTSWSWRVAMGLCCLSKRIHSIFVLRLFNDAPAMLLLYLSTLLFARSMWRTGCFVFSLGVSIKMNVLLFAPGLLILLLQSQPNLLGTVICLSICASVQLILGAPFLMTYPVSYLRKAFELDRVFFYKWTVNWKFLPEDVFVSTPLSILLLLLHLGCLGCFAIKWLSAAKSQTGRYINIYPHLSPEYATQTMFVSNFIGICFSRTLHYQFYCWYFHTLPFLMWMTDAPLMMRIVLVGMVEYAFNVFPATAFSSYVLQSAHFVVLAWLWMARVPSVVEVHDVHDDVGASRSKKNKKS
mmetsp:Transcript_17768/g.35745  ORF Transcript_17768/g.35745 Transcript_17768/m.35745 type:complete len:393 (-) Transcript_17768:114-1292(-)